MKTLLLFLTILLALTGAASAMLVTSFTPRDAFQTLSSGSAHSESQVFNASTRKITVTATQDTYVAIGSAPVATAAGYYLVAKIPAQFGVLGGVEKLSILQVTTGGTVAVAEGFAAP